MQHLAFLRKYDCPSTITARQIAADRARSAAADYRRSHHYAWETALPLETSSISRPGWGNSIEFSTLLRSSDATLPAKAEKYRENCLSGATPRLEHFYRDALFLLEVVSGRPSMEAPCDVNGAPS